MRKLIHKFSIIGGMLVFFFFAGYLQLAYFLRAETESMLRRHGAIEVKEQVERLSADFVLIRFYEKSILNRSNPEAQKKFGSLLVLEKEGIEQLVKASDSSEITSRLGKVRVAIDHYESIFNSLIQIRTEERLGHTQLKSTHKAILFNLFRRNDIELLRPLFNLSHFQESYFSNHRESEVQALSLVLKSLRGKLAKSGALDGQLETYLNSYEELLEKDFFYESRKINLNEEFDSVSLGISDHFEGIAGFVRHIADREEERLKKMRKQMIFSFIFSIGAGLVGVLSILVLLARRIINPVRSLANVARSIRKGNMQTRFHPFGSGRDEISQLGADFNTMLDTLGDREKELTQHRNNLADMVEQRTSKLKQVNDSLNKEIANRIETEQALRLSSNNLLAEKERLAVTLRSIGDGVITTDMNGKVVLLNRIAEVLTGWTQQEAVGKCCDEVFVIKDAKDSVCLLAEKANDLLPLSTRQVLVARGGSEQRIDTSNAIIRDQEAGRIGVVIVFRDMGEREKMEKELHKVKKLESVGILAGGIAHDFNNILMAILGNINLAAELIEPDHKAQGLLSEAEKASMRARDLTQQLLTFACGGDPVTETIDLADLLRDSAHFLLRGSDIACTFDIPEHLWAVDVDTGQINQVVQNLILNAMQAMPDGGRIEILGENIAEVREEDLYELKAGDYVRIAIRDYGSGIPENVLENIFDPYFTTKQKGSGLGLAIIHSIIKKHGGHITASSIEGQGSTFSFYLPAVQSVNVAINEEAAAATANPRARIMVMDDDEMVRNIATHMLGYFGHEVVLVEDGVEALARYRKQEELGEPVDIVIMDLTIPGGMGGRETIGRLLAEFPDARAIVSSGYSTDPVMANYRDYGFKGVMSKPFDLDQIKRVVAEVLDSEE